MDKKRIYLTICAVFTVVALFIYLLFSGTTDDGNGNDAKNAVREIKNYSEQSTAEIKSAGNEIRQAGEQLNRSIGRVDRATESANRVQERIDENSRTIAECRSLIAESRRELDEASELFRQIDEENR